MEGEAVRSIEDPEKVAADIAAAAALQEAAREKEAAANGNHRLRRAGMIAAAVILGLVLVVQLVHHNRHTLATIPAFNSILGPIYRGLGSPLQPSWDITGWRFEATKGSTAGGETEGDTVVAEELTVYSRIGNESDEPLPYPLVGISLTDRFEETIGSRVLQPAEYLANNLDPRELVPPGESFDAVISIPSPSTEATGFKLDVCYQASGERMRCKASDFK